MNEWALQGDPRIDWHASLDENTWAQNAANAVANWLCDGLGDTRGRVRMLVSGGSTPGPVYRRLANADLDWSRVVIGLVDDRDVPCDHKGSNARVVRDQLLRDRADAAMFEPLRESAGTVQAALVLANRRWSECIDQPLVAVLLGLGEDGHTASLFPKAENLDNALTSTQPYAHVDATGCPGAGDFSQRLSLTPFGLVQASQRMLLIRGAKKHDTLLTALAVGPVAAMPIRAAWQPPLAPLHVHWCASE